MKKGSICLLLCVFLFTSVFVEQVYGCKQISAFINNKSQSSDIIVKYNNMPVNLTTKPISSEGFIMVPASEIFGLLGMTSEYDKDKSILRMKKGNNKITIQEGSISFRINGILIKADKAPVKVNNDLLITISLISQGTDAMVSYDEKNNIVLINKYQFPAQDTSAQDSYKAERLSEPLGKTKDELLKLKAAAGNWKDAILKVVSEHKEYDLSMAAKMSDVLGYTKESVLNLKYLLGGWPKVYDEVYYDRIKAAGVGNISVSYYPGFDIRDYLNGMNFEEYGYTTEIAAITNDSQKDILELGRKSGWKKAIEKYSGKILEGASYYGMPEDIITKLQSCGFTALEIFDLARDAHRYSADYKKVYEEIGCIEGINKSNVENYYKKNVWSRRNFYKEPQVGEGIGTDIVDPVLKEEFTIGAADIDSFRESGVNNLIDIAWFKRWGINNKLEIENIMALSSRYKLPIYKVFDTVKDYISWYDIDEALKRQANTEIK